MILPLSVESLRFEAGGKTLVKDISFRLEAGARTIILGPNGAGKSLLLRLCHGLIAPSGGKISWSGEGDPARAQAMVFQRPVMLRRSALANIIFALAARDVPRLEQVPRAIEALKLAKLGRVADRPARVLSGGEQQRLALARAWATRPEVLFLDEPTASLDPVATRGVEDLIEAIHVAGTKIVMTTHDLGQARRLADEIFFLDRGRLLERTEATYFFKKPSSETARAFLAGELFIRQEEPL
jgi:tungstate transport system ATP-binding protein